MISVFAAVSNAYGDLHSINRLNYGLYMTKRKDVTVYQAKWSHTIAVKLPTMDQFGDIPLPQCDFEPACTGKCRQAVAGINKRQSRTTQARRSW